MEEVTCLPLFQHVKPANIAINFTFQPTRPRCRFLSRITFFFTEAVHEEKWEEASMLQGALLNLVSSTSDFFVHFISTDPFI